MRADLQPYWSLVQQYAAMGRLQWLACGCLYVLRRRIGPDGDGGFWLPMTSFMAPHDTPVDAVVGTLLACADVISGRFSLGGVFAMQRAGVYDVRVSR